MGQALRVENKVVMTDQLGPVARTASQNTQDIAVSFEFFPPKNKTMEETLWASVKKLETGADKAEIDDVARAYWDAGIRHIVALRGDPQDGIGKTYQPQPQGYAYGADLVAGLKSIADFEVSVSAYPERHPESADWNAELDNLKRKYDAGATRAITQFFFSPDTFMRFQDRVLDAGIDMPIVPGLMLQPNFKGLKRMSDMCGVHVPEWYHELFEGLEQDLATRQLLTASLVSELTAELYDRSVRHFHLYTLNRADLAYSVGRVLGLHTRFNGAV